MVNIQLLLFDQPADFWIIYAVTAALAISNIVKSSLGPMGLDKMMVDNIGVSVHYIQANNGPPIPFLLVPRK